MKTIGILGGMSAASTQLYYRELCRLTHEKMGGLHSPELIIRSLNFARIEQLQANDAWDLAGTILNTEARVLQRAGADILLLATNTMHKLADQMMQGIEIPLVHIADATAEAINQQGLGSPGLMATAFTMEQSFYLERLRKAGLTPLVPTAGDRLDIHRIIYTELCQGETLPESRLLYMEIASRLVGAGADSLILGCTEVGMLLNRDNVDVPVFDTTLIHCSKAIEMALAG